jgi:predicted nucleic acid-binding protein
VRFLDSNVILRYLTRDDEAKARACFDLFQRVGRNEEQLFTVSAIIAEVANVLSSPRLSYRLTNEEIAARLGPIMSLRGLKIPQKRICADALEIYAASPQLDFEDALAVAHMRHQGIAEILSYDRDFDHISDIERREPLPT